MNRYLAALAGALVVVASAVTIASAGVVMTRTEKIVSGQMGPQPQQPRESTMMVEGNKQKTIISSGREIILDLDKATIDIIDLSQKSYFEMPFPPTGMMGQNFGGPALHVSDFTKTGKTRNVAGYTCEDYNGSGKMPMGEFSTVYCISSKAPGASEFSAFQKTMLAKLKSAHAEMPSSFPDGIPMVENTTTQMNAMNLGNLPPEMAAKLKAQLANRPPIVTEAQVTKVESKKIAASEFEVPAGFTKRDMGAMGMGAHKMGGAPGSSAPPPAGAPPAPKP